MVEISDVEVTPQEEEILSRYSFDFDHIDPVMLDICDLILDDTSGYELQNQIDDAENFRMKGEPYCQRVSFILATCRLIWDEQMIRKSVLEFFTVQNTPMGVKRDETGTYDIDSLQEFIARMTKAVMTNERISKVCKLIFDYYMNKLLCSDPAIGKIQRMTRMKVLRGRKLDLGYNHCTVELVVPEVKVQKANAMDWEGDEESAIKTLSDTKGRTDHVTERWMNCEKEEKELGEAMNDWLHTKFY